MGTNVRYTCGHASLMTAFLRSAKLEGCILGKNTKIGAKADLSKCVTQAGYEVAAAGEFTSL